jgi:hypothetical protein
MPSRAFPCTFTRLPRRTRYASLTRPACGRWHSACYRRRPGCCRAPLCCCRSPPARFPCRLRCFRARLAHFLFFHRCRAGTTRKVSRACERPPSRHDAINPRGRQAQRRTRGRKSPRARRQSVTTAKARRVFRYKREALCRGHRVLLSRSMSYSIVALRQSTKRPDDALQLPFPRGPARQPIHGGDVRGECFARLAAYDKNRHSGRGTPAVRIGRGRLT